MITKYERRLQICSLRRLWSNLEHCERAGHQTWLSLPEMYIQAPYRKEEKRWTSSSLHCWW
nr:MAG TPA: hypothetical protein [Caudoviricetes sp.]